MAEVDDGDLKAILWFTRVSGISWPKEMQEAIERVEEAMKGKKRLDLSELQLTPREHLMVEFIQDYWDEYSIAPTIREIQGEIGGSTSTIHATLKRLEEKDILYVNRMSARTIRVALNQ